MPRKAADAPAVEPDDQVRDAILVLSEPAAQHVERVEAWLLDAGLRILHSQPVACNRTAARRLLKAMCVQEAEDGAETPRKGAASKKRPGTADASAVGLRRVEPAALDALTAGGALALTLAPTAAAPAQTKVSKSPKASTAGASALSVLVGVLGPVQAAVGEGSPRGKGSSASGRGESLRGVLRGWLAEAEHAGDVPCAWAPVTHQGLQRTRAVLEQFARSAAAAAELRTTRVAQGGSSLVSEGQLMDFVFPPHVQHPRSAARLFVVAEYGPLDPVTGGLKGGPAGQRPLGAFELRCLLDEVEVWDALSVVLPPQRIGALNAGEKEESLRALRDIVPEMPRIDPGQVARLLAPLHRVAGDSVDFHAFQAAVRRARLQRITALRTMYPAIAAARAATSHLTAPAPPGRRFALAPRYTAAILPATALSSTVGSARVAAAMGPAAASTALTGVDCAVSKGGTAALTESQAWRRGEGMTGDVGRHGAAGRRAEAAAAARAAAVGAPRSHRSGGGQHVQRKQHGKAGMSRWGTQEGALGRAGAFTLGAAGLGGAAEVDASFLDVRVKRGGNARRRKAAQLLHRNAHKVVGLSSANHAGVAANALLLREEPPPDLPCFNAGAGLSGTGKGSYVAGPSMGR